MHAARAVAIFISLLAMCCVVPRAAAQQSTDIVVSQASVRINGVNVRTGPKVATVRYFSLAAAEKALGRPEQTYRAGLGVQVYSWRKVGVNFQEGFRASDKNKLFKFQVWLADSPMNAQDKYTGKFKGHVRVDGLDISSETTLDAIRPELQERGYKVTEYPHITTAVKGETAIWTVGTTNRIECVEVFCGSQT